ncbi:hypothetical protein ACFV4P_17805 [Kitasatospora sp. NPDC059795]|uniref:hypothetical protein n=1 Tax=Kitasatospora sp. NPDC059795 TaxID=3346949 RepID=UPI00364B3CE6
MRGRIAMAAAATALLLTGCTASSDGPAPRPSLITAYPEAHPATGDAARRAAEVAAVWPGSATRQAWEHGYFAIENTVEWLPKDAFHNNADKTADATGHFDLRATLPVAVSDTAEVQFENGERTVLPRRSAKDVLTWMTDRGNTCTDRCADPLAITAVRPGTTTVATSRGRATIPVWEFTIAGYDEPFRYPAVLSQGPDRPPHGPYTEPVLASVSPDGLILTAGVEHGSCDIPEPGEVYETDQAVVLIPPRITPVHLPEGWACNAAAYTIPVEFRLAHPLGTRPVLGFDDGLPQLQRGRG